jgi:hypothetical protein
MKALLRGGLTHHGFSKRYSGWVVTLPFIGLLGFTGCATQSVQPPPLALNTIIQQSQAGIPAKTIIQQIEDSQSIYPLSASQLADIRDQGVPNAVVDYMQTTYIQSVLQQQNFQDRNTWAYGGNGYCAGGYPYGYDTPYDPRMNRPVPRYPPPPPNEAQSPARPGVFPTP